jgi:TonB family protein
MKRLAMAAALVLFTAAAFADSLRTDRHLVKIEAQSGAGSSRQYNVQIFDAQSRNHVAHLKLVTTGNTPAEGETASGSTQYTVRVVPYGEAYLVEFTANDGQELNETMRGGFTTRTKPAPERAHPSRAGRDVNEPAVVERVDAVYTEEAKAAGAAGTVVVEVLIDKSGFVQLAKVVKPMGYGLSESAVDAVKQWQFAPTVKGRVPVEVVHEVTVEFKP